MEIFLQEEIKESQENILASDLSNYYNSLSMVYIQLILSNKKLVVPDWSKDNLTNILLNNYNTIELLIKININYNLLTIDNKLYASKQSKVITDTTNEQFVYNYNKAKETIGDEEVDLSILAALAGRYQLSDFMGRIDLTKVTETSNFFNKLLYTSSKNIYKKKQWITMDDSRVRPTHHDVNRKIIGVDELFNVGGSKMLYPGDSSNGAALKEIVNCRCNLKYI